MCRKLLKEEALSVVIFAFYKFRYSQQVGLFTIYYFITDPR